MIGKKVIMELRRGIEVSDGMGGYSTTLASLRNITGVLSTLRGAERLAADKITVVADYNFYIDFPIGVTITEKDIFVKGTTEYKIIYINNLGNVQDRRLQITLKEEI
uniref:Head-tail joining protein n=1 Tax=viral metagenome TaxID=1070528 RepID=A0A6H1ZQQ7_9ZZZZ